MASAWCREWNFRADRAKECLPRDDGVADDPNVVPPIAESGQTTLVRRDRGDRPYLRRHRGPGRVWEVAIRTPPRSYRSINSPPSIANLFPKSSAITRSIARVSRRPSPAMVVCT